MSFGSHPLAARFLKGVYESRPSIHRYVETWNVKVVLQFLANLYPPSKLTLKELTLKLFFLLLQVKQTEKKNKLHRISKVTKRKKKQIANLHTYMAILTNIKLDYSSANSIYYCT